MIIKTTEELQQHIRMITNGDFDNVKPSLKRAARYIIRVVGKEVWEAAETHYNSEYYNNVNDPDYEPWTPEEEDPPETPPETPDPDPEEEPIDYSLLDQLVNYIQDALVHYAYWLWSPQGNVIFSDTGYQEAKNDNLQPAPAWKIEKAEQSLLDTAHEFVDDLIEFLDEHIEAFEFWAGSEHQAETKSLFLNSAREFSRYYNINDSRRFYIEIRRFIIEAEKSHIAPIISRETLDLLKEKQKDGDLENDDNALIEEIRPALAYLVMHHAISLLPLEIFPGSITERVSAPASNQKRTGARTELMNTLAAKLQTLATDNLQRLRDYVANLETLEDEPQISTATPDPIITRKTFGV
ncbi:MAG: hypothetical protein PHZ02_15190 [Desulfocapsaceae bacterium]|nr:hypothetical protein [Desulfocapsaceae bacterium]